MEVKSETVNFLRGLATQFGFSELFYERDSFECRSVQESWGQCFRNISAIDRLLKLEQHQRFVERRRSIVESELSKVREQHVFLKGEVARLSMVLSLAESRIESRRILFEGEQLHRRRCECFFGTNGYGYRGEELSETYDLSLLKQCANLAHTDAQYRIGPCLRVLDLSLPSAPAFFSTSGTCSPYIATPVIIIAIKSALIARNFQYHPFSILFFATQISINTPIDAKPALFCVDPDTLLFTPSERL
jgi:hypothetical protein